MTNNKPITIILADDHPLTLIGLIQLFAQDDKFAVLATTTNGSDTVQAVSELKPDILVLDFNMPLLDGISVLKKLNQLPSCKHKSLMYTAHINDGLLLTAIGLGLCGLVSKTVTPDRLTQAIYTIYEGGKWWEGEIIGRVLDSCALKVPINDSLTSREIEVIKLAIKGMRNQEIAEKLHIKESTIKSHLTNIYSKHNLNGRPALLAFAIANGIE